MPNELVKDFPCKKVLNMDFIRNTVGRQLSELQLSEHVGQPNATRSHTHHNLIKFFKFFYLFIYFFAVLMITLEFLAMATAAVKKRKRIVLIIEDKLEMCRLVKQGKTLANLATLFNIAKTILILASWLTNQRNTALSNSS